MSETPEHAEIQKTPKELLSEYQTEYGKKCSMAGDLQYRIKCMVNDLETINKDLMAINQKAAELGPKLKAEESTKEVNV